MAGFTQIIGKLSKLVSFHRKKAGMTQIQLVDLAGVGKSTVFDIKKEKATVMAPTKHNHFKQIETDIFQPNGYFSSEDRNISNST